MRTYRSPLRDRQRAETRAAVIDAARDPFVEQGYAATSIAEIARTAGVSPETVYATFGTKRELLRAVVDAAATGVAEGGAVVDAELLERVRAEPDARRPARDDGRSRATTAPAGRAARRGRAGGGGGRSRDRRAGGRAGGAEASRDIRALVALLAEAGPLRMSERDATDVVWALARSTGFYRSLTVDRGWSHARAFQALNDAIARAVLAD